MYDPTLCQQRVHTCDVTDYDSFIYGTYPAYPKDSLTHQWTKTAGTNPQTGTWVSETDKPHVTWKAPPCTGTVDFKDSVDDVPDIMWMPCDESSTRDDPNVDFTDTATVSLPEGCEYAGPHDTIPYFIEYGDDYHSTTGPIFGEFYGWVPTYDVDFKYSDCKWVCEITNVEARTTILVRDPASLPDMVSVSSASDVPCAEAALAKSDLTDLDLTDDKDAPHTKYWCYDAIVAHEEKHRSDWELFYTAPLAIAIAASETISVTINCADPQTIHCSLARSASMAAIEAHFDEALTSAVNAMDDQSTPVNEAEVRAWLVTADYEKPIADAVLEECTP